jgi:hypothetical protein
MLTLVVPANLFFFSFDFSLRTFLGTLNNNTLRCAVFQNRYGITANTYMRSTVALSTTSSPMGSP